MHLTTCRQEHTPKHKLLQRSQIISEPMSAHTKTTNQRLVTETMTSQSPITQKQTSMSFIEKTPRRNGPVLNINQNSSPLTHRENIKTETISDYYPA
jgi:hypothetical protein